MEQEKYQKLVERSKSNRLKSYRKHLINLQDKPEYRIRQALNTIRLSNRSGSHLNYFKYNLNNSEEHEDTKFKIFKILRKNSIPVFIEPIFLENKGEADVLDCLNWIIYEVTFSETEERLNEKIKKYPDIFAVIRIDAKKQFEEKEIIV